MKVKRIIPIILICLFILLPMDVFAATAKVGAEADFNGDVNIAGAAKIGDGVWTNYINITNAGVMTAVGTATIAATTVTGFTPASGSLTLAGADALTLTTTAETNVTLPTTGTLATTSDKLSAFAATTSAELAGVISDETGTDKLVYNTSPTLVTPTLGAATATTLGCGTITIANGSGLSLQEDITFTGATTENLIKMPDNLAVALQIAEAGNAYITFVTTNDTESVTFGKDIILGANSIGRDADNDIDFETDNKIIFRTNATDRMEITSTGELDMNAGSVGFTLQAATGDGTTTIDWKLGNHFKFTHGAMAETFTFTAPSNPCNLTLIIIQDGVGGRDSTWPETVKWLGAEPTWSDGGVSKGIVVGFIYDGTNFWAQATPWQL